jgi:hypothetical protein
MSEILQLNSTPVQVKDDEFATGYQVGYLHFKKDFQGKVLITDELLSTIVAQTFIDVHHTGRCNAGYLVGFIAALLEKEPKRRFQIVGSICLTNEIGGSNG